MNKAKSQSLSDSSDLTTISALKHSNRLNSNLEDYTFDENLE